MENNKKVLYESNIMGSKVIDEDSLEYKIYILEQSIDKIDKRYIKTKLIVKDVVKYIRLEYVYQNNFDHLNNIHNLLSNFPMDIVNRCYNLKKYDNIITAEVIQVIITNKLNNINITDHNNWTFGHYICGLPKPDINVLKLLLDRGLNINAKDDDGDTIVDVLIMKDEVNSHILEILDLLLEYGLDLHDKNYLDYVINNYPKKYQLIKYLIDKV